MKRISVLGSTNIDLVSQGLDRFPRPGETLSAKLFSHYPGGKGANQAVAASRLGGKVSFFGKVGTDEFGAELLEHMHRDDVDVSAVQEEEDIATGTASIWVTDTGNNAIVCAPGANGRVDPTYIDHVLPQLVDFDILLLQLEIPLGTIEYLLRQLPEGKPFVILDPSPAHDLSHLRLNRVDMLIPNRNELDHLIQDHKGIAAAKRLLKLGVGAVLCTDGSKGARLIEKDNISFFPPIAVEVVDGTAAGDAFGGALAASLAEGCSIHESIPRASAAGALATTREGAQPSLPSLREVEALLHDKDRYR